MRHSLTVDDFRNTDKFLPHVNTELIRVGELEPPFVTEKWLNETCPLMTMNFESNETSSIRVAPMAVVRCSRGGKTRSLKEIGNRFKVIYPDCEVIFVSFNDFSCIHYEE